ncbi:MAG: type II secretion system minor pseudopilin GspI [Betaproteobacteria bacterium]|nr:type II secretion system minor pseudopilin GspI [Betaproteobacteria bacterium]
MAAGRAEAIAAWRGFTLVEVLVALSILAVALLAASRASGLTVTASADHRDRLLANWVADNRLNDHQARDSWAAPGEYGGSERQAGLEFQWREQVSATPNPRFRRVEVTVRRAAAGERVLATRVGFLVRREGQP